MSRHLLGIIGITLTLAGFIGFYISSMSDSHLGMASGVGIRVGVLLCVLWMALPQIVHLAKHTPKWMMGLVAAGLVVVIFGSRTLAFVIPIVLALGGLQLAVWFLKPKGKPRKPRSRPPANRAKEQS